MLRTDGKTGGELPVRTYDAIRFFILEQLQKSESLSLADLLDNGSLFFKFPDCAWLLLQVKLDLQARRLITAFTLPPRKRVVCLKITREGAKLLMRLHQKKNLDYSECETITTL